MNDGLWRIVRDFDRGRLMAVYTVCPTCWPQHHATYEAETRRGWKTDVKAVASSIVTADDECRCCGARTTVGRVLSA